MYGLLILLEMNRVMDPGEESFTSTSFDFNSTLRLYSSDDEDNGFTYEQLSNTNKDDVDAYIEFELPPAAMPLPSSPPPAPSSAISQVAAVSNDDNEEEELEFRISFSAVIPFPGFSPSRSINSANTLSSIPSLSNHEDAKAQMTKTAAIDSSSQPAVESTLSCTHRKQINSHSSISIFPLAWTRFPPPINDSCHRPLSYIDGWELVCSRKSSASAADGGITKLLVKLRSIVRSGLGSIRLLTAQKNCANSSKKPVERWLTLCKPSEPQQRITSLRADGGSSCEMRSPSMIEMKIEAMRKVFGSAVSPLKNNGISKSGRLNKSCPTSIKSSPVHQSGDASLLYAAIAHCKRSFHQNDDFSF